MSREDAAHAVAQHEERSTRSLVGDLAEKGFVQARPAPTAGEHRDVKLLERLLEGIRAL